MLPNLSPSPNLYELQSVSFVVLTRGTKVSEILLVHTCIIIFKTLRGYRYSYKSCSNYLDLKKCFFTGEHDSWFSDYMLNLL